jgi:lipid II:glycine glycyltransferase (peptidoglycan interpeptide bridge formation enzyme)
LTIKIVQSLEENSWRNYVNAHPDSNIYHTPEMFQVYKKTDGYEPHLWSAIDENGRPLALLLPVDITVMSSFLKRFTSRAVVFGGILSNADESGREALSLLLAEYKRDVKNQILFTECRNLSDLKDIQPVLSEEEFVYEEHLNYLIDLEKPEDELWKNISRSGRQRIRSSKNKNAYVEEIDEITKIDRSYELLKQVYHDASVPLADLSLFETAFDILNPAGMMKILTARSNGDYMGTCFLLLHKGRIIHWYAGNDRNYSAFSPGELLVWHALKWGKENNYHVFDFGGAGKPNEPYGPRNFKSKFGGNLVNYGRNTYIHSRLKLKLSLLGYRLLRKFF